jgi:hypothetical protein
MTCRNGKKRVGLVSTVSWEQDYLTDDEESYESDDEEEEGDEAEGEGEDVEDKNEGSTDGEDSNQDQADKVSSTEVGAKDARYLHGGRI